MFRLHLGVVGLSLLSAVDPLGVWAQKSPAKPAASTVTLTTATGSLLQRATPSSEWKTVPTQSAVAYNSVLLAVPSATLEGPGVRALLLADPGDQSPFPILEAACTLKSPTKGVALDVLLDRGRMDFVQTAEKGAVTVRVRYRNQKWQLTLNEPKSRVAIEVSSRWLPGVPFTREPHPGQEPVADVIVMAIKGTASLNTGRTEFALSAPPGPAYFHWNSVDGSDPSPRKLDQLPEWASPAKPTPAAQAALKRLRQALANQPPSQVLKAAVAAADAEERRLAVLGLAATDHLPALLDALADKTHADVRETACRALRHWIGRGVGQDQKVFEALQTRKYKPGEAAIVVQLLHRFNDEQLKEPATWDALLAYLDHKKRSIRQLAVWQLVQLTGAAKDIAYDAAASSETRAKAIEQWKQRLSQGPLKGRP